MQRELGDGLGGGNEGQEVDPRGFQSVVQDRVDLISWDGDLSAGGPPDNMPQVTEGRDNLQGPNRADFDQAVRQRETKLYSIVGRCLEHCNKVHKLWQNIKQVSLVLTMVEVEIVFCWMVWANLMLWG